MLESKNVLNTMSVVLWCESFENSSNFIQDHNLQSLGHSQFCLHTIFQYQIPGKGLKNGQSDSKISSTGKRCF